MSVKFLGQKVAQAIDVELMSASGGFSIDQLMELAGLSVAEAIQKSFDKAKQPKVLVCVGPGNNGGDGLVASRHLLHFGFKPVLYYPKQPDKDIYKRLLLQCENLEIAVHKDYKKSLVDDSDIIVDGLFGFSFHGDVRDPYKEIVHEFLQTKKPIVSIDIPSGWDVESGPTKELNYQPAVLVSLTAPKKCAEHFTGRHFLGGRFVPPSLLKKFDFSIPDYPGGEQVVELK